MKKELKNEQVEKRIEALTINKGFWYGIKVVSVTIGFAQILKEGKWVNQTTTPQRFEDEVLTLGKYFQSHEKAEKFMTTKQFKSLMNNIQKNWL